MSKIYYLSDFFLEDSSGGAELVDETICKFLKAEKIKSLNLKSIDYSSTYVISNISLLPDKFIRDLEKHPNYIIVEHDYKICKSRHPWRYKDCIVPEGERINYALYKNAKAIFVQTTDHLNVFKANKVEGNFVNLYCSVWSEEELSVLSKYTKEEKRTFKFAVLESSNWIKNTEGAINFCKSQGIDFAKVSANNWESFIQELSHYPALVFFPTAKESCCRLVIEARCLQMNLITSKNYGAVLEPYINLSGNALIRQLSVMSSNNLAEIKKYV